MLLLNPVFQHPVCLSQNLFTFQYASIKPLIDSIFSNSSSRNLHFNMLLLNPSMSYAVFNNQIHLHFNMLLLNQLPNLSIRPIDNHLHFNMLLLNRSLFAAHAILQLYLHFNMLLLNPHLESPTLCN